MRIYFALALAGTILISLPATAGTVTVTGGQVTWQSNQCTAPAEPSAKTPGPETRANTINERVVEYNNYAKAAQDYMSCLSNEAERDAGIVSQSIAGQAQTTISAMQKKVTDFGAPLHHPTGEAPAPTPGPTPLPKPVSPPVAAPPTQTQATPSVPASAPAAPVQATAPVQAMPSQSVPASAMQPASTTASPSVLEMTAPPPAASSTTSMPSAPTK